MLTYKPKRYIKAAVKAVAVMTVALVAVFTLSVLKIGNDLLNQALIFAIVAGIVYILTRYAIYEYTYALGESEISVTRIAGRVPNTIFRLAINKDDTFIRVSGKKELRALGVKRIENACANLSPRERMYAYITIINDQKAALLFEADELFANAVNERINIKKITEATEKSEEGENL